MQQDWLPSQLLGEHGPFAQQLEGFQPRAQQQAMADAVAEAIAEREVLVAEAGTGTGKTFAYLVPALLAHARVVISTGTRTLQDQLFHRDIPIVRAATGIGTRVALLKGRSNYLCLHRYERARESDNLARKPEQWSALTRWADHTQSGDRSELARIPEEASLWQDVTSTTDNCLGQRCNRYQDCYLVKARRAAQQAEVVVVNHHLLLADMALRDEGFGELLPQADAYIIDEAHQLPELAATFFGTSVSSRQLQSLALDVERESVLDAPEADALRSTARRVDAAARGLRAAIGGGARRADWNELQEATAFEEALVAVDTGLDELVEALGGARERGEGLAHCARRAALLQERLQTLTSEPPDDELQWVDVRTRACVIQRMPIEAGARFAERMRAYADTWVFTSATLAVNRDFSFFTQRLGLESLHAEAWGSPFAFDRNALMYLPPGLPDPNAPEYTERMLEAVIPVLEASEGRAFVLFTSHRALREAAGRLHGRIDFPLLVQGQAPRSVLLARFRKDGHAVLLGSASFWEGVDVRGSSLSCVVIDRLPFAPPDDPLVRARIVARRARGRDAFREYQLPSAVLSLKQGLGRLIRDPADRGVMMVCDPRLQTRNYARVFLDSLPPIPRSHRIDEVRAFFQAPQARGALA